MKTALLVLVALLALTSCSSWYGPAEIRLKDGTVLQCPKGLTFQYSVVTCGGKGVTVPWAQVSGYSTK